MYWLLLFQAIAMNKDTENKHKRGPYESHDGFIWETDQNSIIFFY